MNTPQPSTPVAEPGASKLLFDSTQLPQLSQLHSSSALMGQTTEVRMQRMKSSLREHAAALMQPPKKVGPSPTAWQSVRAILSASYLNILLICIPISWALNFVLPNQHTLIFVFSFLAIIPLARLLAFASDELSLRVSHTLAGIMNVTLGNVVELIISIVALIKCELNIVQSSLIGSILILVLGMCFFAGGLRFSEQGFVSIVAQMNSSLLTISVIAVLLPGTFSLALGSQDSQISIGQSILDMSHGVAIILLFIYGSYLCFQLISHKTFYLLDSEETLQSKKYSENPFKIKKSRHGKQPVMSQYTSPQPTQFEEETEVPQMSVAVSIGFLVIITALIAVTAVIMIDSISGMADTRAISTEFIGVILLPIAGNASGHITAVTVSVKDKLTLSLGVAVGSSIQIALLVTPFIVTLGWIIGKPLTLLFDPLQSIVLFLSVLTVNNVFQYGKSNWLEGMILICLYVILCVTFWYYPGAGPILVC